MPSSDTHRYSDSVIMAMSAVNPKWSPMDTFLAAYQRLDEIREANTYVLEGLLKEINDLLRLVLEEREKDLSCWATMCDMIEYLNGERKYG